MIFNINKIIKRLIDKKELFVSERHLQVAFALMAKEIYPHYQYIPEYVFDRKKRCHIDLIIVNGKEKIAIEFKYVVAKGVISVPGNESYVLRNHSAIDIRRHQCVNDVARLENYRSDLNFNCTKGFFLLITNMNRFWEGSKKNSVAQQFDIKNNTILKKGKHKAVGKSAFGKKYKPIYLKRSYRIQYKDYLKTNSNNFKYLCIDV